MILAVTGGKGGVGKSTVSYNLGMELDAVVIDGDLGMADLPAGHGPDLHDVLAGRATPLEAVDESGPVALLPCGRTLAGTRAADPTALTKTVRTVASEYDRVVIDSPAGLRCDAGLPLLAADACLLVTRPTKPAVIDALRTRELARAIGTPLARVICNRAPANNDNCNRLGTTLGAPVTTVPESPLVARAQRSGQPVHAIAPDSEPTQAFASIADAVEQMRIDTATVATNE